jgi:hypothetical protein
MVLAPPIVQAAAQKVNITKSITLPVKGSVNVKNNGATAAAQDLGALGEELGKRQTVDTISGGEGFFGAGVCGATTDPVHDNDTSSDNRVVVPAAAPGEPDNVVAGIIIGGQVGTPATVTVKAPELPSGESPIIALRTSAENPTEYIGLNSGLRASPSRLVFQCPAGAPDGNSFVVIGH